MPTENRLLQNLTAAQWQELKTLSGLPDSARHEIEGVIRFLREQPSLQHPLKLEIRVSKKNIYEAAESLKCALTAIDALIDFGGHLVKRPLQPRPDSNVLARGLTKDELVAYRDATASIHAALEYSKQQNVIRGRLRPGRSFSHSMFAVGMLDEIVFRETGRRLNQKNRNRNGIWLSEFARQLFKIANPTFSTKDRKIDNLIKRLQSTRAGDADKPKRRRKK